MLIREEKLRHWIDHFYGYGSWRAPLWFVGYEDTGGNYPEEVAGKLNFFYQSHGAASEPIVCDIREIYRHVPMALDGVKGNQFQNRYEYRFGPEAVQSNVWKNLSCFVHGYHDLMIPDLLVYQKEKFLSLTECQEALLSLYPLPSPHNHAWYYSWLDVPIGYLKTRVLYQDHLYRQRIKTLLSNIKLYKPEVVLMYGMNNINAIKASVQEIFSKVKFKMIKATPGVIPQHHKAELNQTTLLITTQIPALRHNRIETGFDWEALGKRVRSEKGA